MRGSELTSLEGEKTMLEMMKRKFLESLVFYIYFFVWVQNVKFSVNVAMVDVCVNKKKSDDKLADGST